MKTTLYLLTLATLLLSGCASSNQGSAVVLKHSELDNYKQPIEQVLPDGMVELNIDELIASIKDESRDVVKNSFEPNINYLDIDEVNSDSYLKKSSYTSNLIESFGKNRIIYVNSEENIVYTERY
jgi:hypothetical protein